MEKITYFSEENRLLWRFERWIPAEHLEQCLTHRKCSKTCGKYQRISQSTWPAFLKDSFADDQDSMVLSNSTFFGLSSSVPIRNPERPQAGPQALPASLPHEHPLVLHMGNCQQHGCTCPSYTLRWKRESGSFFFLSSSSVLDQWKERDFNSPVERELMFPQAALSAQRSGGINKDAINANSSPYLCGQSVLIRAEGRKIKMGKYMLFKWK